MFLLGISIYFLKQRRAWIFKKLCVHKLRSMLRRFPQFQASVTQLRVTAHFPDFASHGWSGFGNWQAEATG